MGSFRPGGLDRLWLGWGVGCALSIVALAPKWHHGYYWMVVAPLSAVWVARALARIAGLGNLGRMASVALGSFFLTLCGWQSGSTFRTPPEWVNIVEAGREAAEWATDDRTLVAPEALLYYADRRGDRLEFDPAAARRAAGEWGLSLPDADDPIALVRFYRAQNDAIYPKSLIVADCGPDANDPRRRAWREAIRAGRPRVNLLIDRPDLMIAEY